MSAYNWDDIFLMLILMFVLNIFFSLYTLGLLEKIILAHIKFFDKILKKGPREYISKTKCSVKYTVFLNLNIPLWILFGYLFMSYGILFNILRFILLFFYPLIFILLYEINFNRKK